MKKAILLLSILMCGIGFSNAQEQSTIESKLTDQITELCDLSPEQVAKVKPLVTDFEKKRDDTYKKYHHNPTALNKEVKKNKWDYEVSLIGILTPEQMGLLKAFDQQNPPVMIGGMRKNYKPVYYVSAK